MNVLLAVQLDDELFADRYLDVLAQRQAPDHPAPARRVHLEPLGNGATPRVQVVLDARSVLRRTTKLDVVADLHEIRRHGHLASIHGEMAVGHHLARLTPRGGEAEAVDDVVEPELEETEQVLARHALFSLRRVEVAPELTLQHAVDKLRLLLLAQLDTVRRVLSAVQSVLAPGARPVFAYANL